MERSTRLMDLSIWENGSRVKRMEMEFISWKMDHIMKVLFSITWPMAKANSTPITFSIRGTFWTTNSMAWALKRISLITSMEVTSREIKLKAPSNGKTTALNTNTMGTLISTVNSKDRVIPLIFRQFEGTQWSLRRWLPKRRKTWEREVQF